MTRIRGTSLLLALLTAASSSHPLAAQSDLGLPAAYQSNVLATARSPLYFQPVVLAHPGTRYSIGLDYANIYELSYGYLGGSYVQDLELGTLHFAASRDLNPRTFVQADLPVSTAWKGGLDGFLHWWHGLLGIKIPERDLRPENRFAFWDTLANGRGTERAPTTYLGDLRIGIGHRLGPNTQILGTLTLPTTTSKGYGKGVPSAGAILGGWSDLDPRIRVEGTLGVGFTPRTDDALRQYQRNAFVAAGGGVRWRFAGSASMFATGMLHTPYYHHTTMPALDRPDFIFDFGWIFRTKGGGEWRIGMTEDAIPSGPGVDAIFKATRTW